MTHGRHVVMGENQHNQIEQKMLNLFRDIPVK